MTAPWTHSLWRSEDSASWCSSPPSRNCRCHFWSGCKTRIPWTVLSPCSPRSIRSFDCLISKLYPAVVHELAAASYWPVGFQSNVLSLQFGTSVDYQAVTSGPWRYVSGWLRPFRKSHQLALKCHLMMLLRIVVCRVFLGPLADLSGLTPSSFDFACACDVGLTQMRRLRNHNRNHQ